MSFGLCDEFEGGFGWTEPGFLERTSHAVEVRGAVLVFDPVDMPGIDERIRALGEPEAVVQLLDRHERDSAAVAARLGVPHLRMELDAHGGAGRLVRIVGRRRRPPAPRRLVTAVDDRHQRDVRSPLTP